MCYLYICILGGVSILVYKRLFMLLGRRDMITGLIVFLVSSALRKGEGFLLKEIPLPQLWKYTIKISSLTLLHLQ